MSSNQKQSGPSSADAWSIWSRDGKQVLEDAAAILNLNSLITGNGITADVSSSSDSFDVHCLRKGDTPSATSLCCSLCLITFSSREDQVDHFRSDWHVTNLRRKLRKKLCLSEQEFEDMVAGGSSDSEPEPGDDTSDADDKSLSETTSSAVKMHLNNRLQSGNKIYFRTSHNDVYCIHRCNLINGDNDDPGSLLSQLLEGNVGRIWTILLLSGGRFAGSIFDGSEVLIHKTFHSYTTRRKQGGAQSTRDGAQSGRAPRSAGASLRRYNEAALQDHIRTLLDDWRSDIQKSHRIFLRCSSYHKVIFFGGKDPILLKSDPRISNVPIITKRPVFAEVKRVHQKLSQVEFCGTFSSFMEIVRSAANESVSKEKRASPAKRISSSVRRSSSTGPSRATSSVASSLLDDKADSDDGCRSLQSITLDDIKRIKRKARQSKAKVTGIGQANEECNQDAPALSQELKTRIYTVSRSGDAEALKIIVDKVLGETNFDGISDNSDHSAAPASCTSPLLRYLNCPFGPEQQTFLHVAASEGHGTVLRLLLELGVDPCLKNGKGLVPYQVCAAKPIRKMFSRFRADNPDKWDWKQAQIPEPLDPAVEAEQQAKLSAKRKEAKKIRNDRLKEKKAEERKKEAEDAEKAKFLSLSDREKRALAAERRLLNQARENETVLPVLSRCFECGVDITGTVPFEYSNNVFCTTGCVKIHRKRVSASALG